MKIIFVLKSFMLLPLKIEYIGYIPDIDKDATKNPVTKM